LFEFERFKRTDEYNEWFNRLDATIRGSLTKLLHKYKTDKKLPGTAGLLKNADSVGEMRFKFGPGYRIYFCQYGKVVILLLIGGDKDTQLADIKTAKAIKARELKILESKKGR